MHSRGMFLFLSLGLLPTVLSAPTPTLMTFTALNVHGEKANVERTWARNDRVYHLSGIIAKHIGAPDNWKANYDGAFIEDAMYSGGITRPSGRRDIIYFQVEAPGSEKCPVGSHCLGFSARGWDLQNRFKGSYMGLFKQRVPATHVAKVFNDPFELVSYKEIYEDDWLTILKQAVNEFDPFRKWLNHANPDRAPPASALPQQVYQDLLKYCHTLKNAPEGIQDAPDRSSES